VSPIVETITPQMLGSLVILALIAYVLGLWLIKRREREEDEADRAEAEEQRRIKLAALRNANTPLNQRD
jgi:membrane protein implicated in regulation of membrane protease activity